MTVKIARRLAEDIIKKAGIECNVGITSDSTIGVKTDNSFALNDINHLLQESGFHLYAKRISMMGDVLLTYSHPEIDEDEQVEIESILY